jgi:hypothetical protein
MDGFDSTIGSDRANDLQSGVNKVKELGRELGDAVLTEGKAAIENVTARADDFSKDLAALTENGLGIVRERVAHQPLTALGLAALAGAFIAATVLRR